MDIKIDIDEFKDQMYQQHLQRMKDTFDSYFRDKTVCRFARWRNRAMVMKVKSVGLENEQLYFLGTDGIKYFVGKGEKIEILD